VLTNISLPCNAGIADRTTWSSEILSRFTFTRTAREGTSTDFGRVQLSADLLHISGGFCQFTFLCHSLWLDGCNYLRKRNNVKASRMFGQTRKAPASPESHISYLTAYPAIAGGAAKDQLRGRREFVYKADVFVY